ncbi:hypothetical protein BKA59DRAFT_474848, partial [Fusarium tricinctum]
MNLVFFMYSINCYCLAMILGTCETCLLPRQRSDRRQPGVARFSHRPYDRLFGTPWDERWTCESTMACCRYSDDPGSTFD